MDAPEPCRYSGCDAPIIFAWTGRAVMPLDAAPDPAGNVEIIDGVAVVHGQVPLVHGTLYMPHFATCSGTNRPSRRRRAPGPSPSVPAARARRDSALATVARNTDEEWKRYAWGWLLDYLRVHPELFGDDLWDAGLARPRDMRHLGPLVQRLRREGLIAPSGMRPRRSGNLTAAPVWRSLLYEPASLASEGYGG